MRLYLRRLPRPVSECVCASAAAPAVAYGACAPDSSAACAGGDAAKAPPAEGDKRRRHGATEFVAPQAPCARASELAGGRLRRRAGGADWRAHRSAPGHTWQSDRPLRPAGMHRLRVRDWRPWDGAAARGRRFASDARSRSAHSACGEVFSATDRSTNSTVAVKKINFEAMDKKELLVNEISVMKDAVHKNIVNYIGCMMHNNRLWVRSAAMRLKPAAHAP